MNVHWILNQIDCIRTIENNRKLQSTFAIENWINCYILWCNRRNQIRRIICIHTSRFRHRNISSNIQLLWWNEKHCNIFHTISSTYSSVSIHGSNWIGLQWRMCSMASSQTARTYYTLHQFIVSDCCSYLFLGPFSHLWIPNSYTYFFYWRLAVTCLLLFSVIFDTYCFIFFFFGLLNFFVMVPCSMFLFSSIQQCCVHGTSQWENKIEKLSTTYKMELSTKIVRGCVCACILLLRQMWNVNGRYTIWESFRL